MRGFKKINQKQIKHLLKALKQSNYYFGSTTRRENLKIDSRFVESLQLFLLDSKGKDVRRVINAFRSVDESFSEIGNIDYVSFQVRKKIMSFLKRNLPPKKFKKAEKLLDSTQKSLEIGMLPAHSHPHPQKVLPVEEFFFEEEEEKDGRKVDFSLNLY